MESIRVEMAGRKWTFEASASGCRMAGRTLIDAADELAGDDDGPEMIRVEVPAQLAETIDELVGLRDHTAAQG